jgi:hypothetical protein
MDEFTLWMQSLDASKVAAEESFRSENHRNMLNVHEFEKSRIAMNSSRLDEHERKLAELARHWRVKDKRAETRQRRTEANPITFTDKQLEAAEKALRKKA